MCSSGALMMARNNRDLFQLTWFVRETANDRCDRSGGEAFERTVRQFLHLSSAISHTLRIKLCCFRQMKKLTNSSFESFAPRSVAPIVCSFTNKPSQLK